MDTPYLITFEFTDLRNDETFKGTVPIKTEEPIDPDNPDHFKEIAKIVYREINKNEQVCNKVRIISVAEDSDMVREIREILNGSSIKPEDADDIII